MYFWSTIRKLKANYHACRGVLEEDVCKLLQTHAIVARDAAAAQEALLTQLPGLGKYRRALHTPDEREHFVRHLRRYVAIYLPDCPFEVGTTNRYTVQTAEACIRARRAIKKGEIVKYLSGIQVEMTEKEEEELSSRTDFSIVLSSRRKRPSLFLGPARFANHDCDSNATLNTTGPHGIHIVAAKDIAVGEEITVVYGWNYFGEDNCECLCATCERLARNGWDPRGPVLQESSSEDEDDEQEEAAKAGKKMAGAHGDVVKPVRTPAHAHHGPSAMNKRKVVDDDDLGAEADVSESEIKTDPHQVSTAALPVKRGRGRPRKYPRTVVDHPPVTGPSSHPAPRVSAERTTLGQERELVYRRRSKEDAAASEPQEVRPAQTAPKLQQQEQHQQREQQSPDAMEPVKSEIPDPLMRKVMNLLYRTAERVEASPPTQQIQPDGRAIGSTNERFEYNSAASHVRARDSPTSGTPSPSSAYSRFMPDRWFHSSTARSEPGPNPNSQAPGSRSARPSTMKSHLDVTKPNKLPSVRKERSFSSLRTVINAGETQQSSTDPYNLLELPPTLREIDQASREATYPPRGREPSASHHDTSETRQSSSSSAEPSEDANASSSHSRASASSSTSIEYVHGSIAQNICQMLTSPEPATAVKHEDDEEALSHQQEASPRPAPVTRGIMRSSLRSHARKEASPSTSAAKSTVSKKRTPRTPAPNVAPQQRKLTRSTSRILDTPASPPVRSIENRQRLRRGLDGGGDSTPLADDASDAAAHVKRGPPRTPRDYTLCRALLLTSCHRWVECRNCDEFFVQDNAYQTRIACPRCERHSKLYGYHWPKTEKEGRNDTEERILDHRLIHRFIEPEEERSERKGRAALEDILRGESERGISVGEEGREVESLDGVGVGVGASGRRSFRNSPRWVGERRSMSRRGSGIRS